MFVMETETDQNLKKTFVDIKYIPTREGGPKIANIPLHEGLNIKTADLVMFAPGDIGGNHSHPRTETFIVTLGKLEVHLLEKDGETKIINLEATENGHRIITMPPDVPHAVINNSNETATMLELADQEMDPSTKKKVKII